MSIDVTRIPSPIRFGLDLRTRGDGHVIVERPQRGDLIDFTTCECAVSRVIHGVRYDTGDAILVASRLRLDEDHLLCLRQVYRSHKGRWFVVQAKWSFDSGECNDNLIVPIRDEQVLMLLRPMIQDRDCLTFLRGWYCRGWVPRNDAFVLQWAEAFLPADACEYLIDAFDTIPAGPDE